ncbi:hypothetical protein ACHAWX_003255 [Stephanocyclus meneghinianus]
MPVGIFLDERTTTLTLVAVSASVDPCDSASEAVETSLECYVAFVVPFSDSPSVAAVVDDDAKEARIVVPWEKDDAPPSRIHRASRRHCRWSLRCGESLRVDDAWIVGVGFCGGLEFRVVV